MTFDINTNIETDTVPIDPPWLFQKKSKAAFSEWFQKTRPVIEKINEYRILTFGNNLLWYTGEFDRTVEYRWAVPGQRDSNIPHRILPRIFSHLTDLLERRVANLSRYKPAFECVPTNSEETDRVNARLLDLGLKNIFKKSAFDLSLVEAERWNAVFGEIYFGVEWNQNIGDRRGYRSYERIGDVDIYIKEPWTVLPAPKRKWDDVSWVIDIKEIIHVEEARKKYGVAIEPDGNKYIFSFNADTEVHEKREDEVVVYRVIQIPTVYNPTGRITTFITDKIVEDITEYPYSHFGFPFERHTDLDVPGRLFPMSYLQHIKPVQHVYNKLTSMMVRNMLLVGHPHIMLPVSSGAKIEDFGNRPTAIKFNGPDAPKVLTFNSIPQEFFNFRKEAKDEMGQIYGVQGVSRGAPPPGARAASMLKFYEEQEEQRASTQIIKHNDLIRRVAKKAASIMGEMYPVSGEERLIRVLGKENQYQIKKFAESKFSSEYDVVIQNSTGFSESMAGRLEEIGLIQEKCPGQLAPEQIADVLELKNTKKAYDILTAAIRQAQDENEMFLDGEEPPAPKPYQDLVIHWRQHLIFVNSSTFERSLPRDKKEIAFRHIKATEMLMEEKKLISPAFAEQLKQLPGYPAIFHPEPQKSLQNGGEGGQTQTPLPGETQPLSLSPEMMAQLGPQPSSDALSPPPEVPPNMQPGTVPPVTGLM